MCIARFGSADFNAWCPLPLRVPWIYGFFFDKAACAHMAESRDDTPVGWTQIGRMFVSRISPPASLATGTGIDIIANAANAHLEDHACSCYKIRATLHQGK